MNPWFGAESDFRTFVHTAHADNIKVFLDFVAYGTSQQSSYYESAYNNLSSPFSNMFAWTNSAHTESNSAYSYTTWNGDTVTFAYWNMNNSLAPNVELSYAKHWLNPDFGSYTDAGVDGFRCDHAVDSYDAYGPNGLGYTTANFWTPFKASLKALYPHLFIFGEQNDWSLYGNTFEPPFDAMFTKPLEFAVRSSIGSGNAIDFMQTLADTVISTPSQGTYLCTFGDHDVDRLMTDIGDTFPRGQVAAALQMGQPYPPIIYYGDEIGMHGAKNTNYSGDASDIPDREPFKWNAVASAPMSDYFVYNSQAYNGRIEQNHDGRSAQEEEPVTGSLLNTYKKLITVRKDSQVLLNGDYEPVEANSAGCAAFVRRVNGAAVLVVANLSGSTATYKIDLGSYTVPSGTEVVRDLITGTVESTLTTANRTSYPVTLAAFGYRYLSFTVSTLPSFFPRADGYMPPSARPPLTVYQTNASSIGTGSRIDEGRLLMYGNRLYFGATGSIDPSGGSLLVLLIDANTGGQTTLDLANVGTTPPGVSELNGTAMPAGFQPDAMAVINVANGDYYIDWYALPTSGSAIHTYRGGAPVNFMYDQLTGGTNPNNLQVGVQNNEIASGTAHNGINTGLEFSIPLIDIPGVKLPGGTVKVMAFLMDSAGNVSNQFLPPLPATAAGLGKAPDLAKISGIREEEALATDIANFTVSAPAFTGTTTTGEITIAEAAPTGGLKVSVTSLNGYYTVPPTVTVPAGSTTATFSITAAGDAGNHAGTIGVKSGQVTVYQTVEKT